MSLTQIILAVAALVAAGAVGFGEIRARSAQAEAREAREQLAACGRSVLVQNTHVAVWKEAASAARAEGAAALASAVAATAANGAELKRLRAAKPSSCSDAVRLVREGLRP